LVPINGEYKFCFDNSFSSFNRKTVFFELIIENEGEETEGNAIDELEGLTPEEIYELKVQDILDSIGKVKTHITKARQIQDMLRAFEAKDRNVAEENYYKVNYFSSFQTILMIFTGIIQLFLIKSLFETDHNSKGYKIWHKISEKF
jgi:protein ERP2